MSGGDFAMGYMLRCRHGEFEVIGADDRRTRAVLAWPEALELARQMEPHCPGVTAATETAMREGVKRLNERVAEAKRLWDDYGHSLARAVEASARARAEADALLGPTTEEEA